MRYIRHTIGALCMLAGTVTAASAQQTDTGILPFLNMPSDARSAGMAGAGTLLPDNPAAIYENAAAALTGTARGGIGIFAGPWTSGFSTDDVLCGAGGYYAPDSKNLVLAGFRRISGPETTMTDALGFPVGSMRSQEWSAEAGYGRLFAGRWAVAVTAHYVRSDSGFDDAVGGVMFGLHGAYKGRFRNPDKGLWSAGLSLLNCGPSMRIGGKSYPLPLRLRAGASATRIFSRNHTLAGGLEIDCLMQSSIFNASIGAEYTFLRHGVIRAGYRMSTAPDGSGSHASAGCGFIA
ncbi:MAG: PorV/PorQ family protein, partial [Alistipes sp.]|nr:PorV/PorQ family protein [Alistipes sp.]